MPKPSAPAKVKLKPSLEKDAQINVELGKIITEKLGELENQLGCSHEELSLWHLKHQNILQTTMLILLRTAVTYELDPTLGQIIFIEVDGTHKPYITMNGWITIIHRQAQFDGVHFEYSPTETGGIPSWVECTIWRKDCKEPIRTREYYQDIQRSDSDAKEIPIRVLRNRTLSACARLAFGITIPELYVGSFKFPDINNHPKFSRGTTKPQSLRAPVNSEHPSDTSEKAPETRSALLKRQLQSMNTVINPRV